MQGTIAELRDSGGTQVVIEADPIDRARILLASSRTVSAVSDDGSSLRARLTDPDAVADLNRRLGAAVVLYGVLVALHAANPAHHGPAGGVTNLGHAVFLLGALGTVAAIIVGASAGADDLNAGVFRELVVTGRSRWSLFWARIPGGLIFLLPFVVVAYALTAVASVGFAGSLAAPSPTLLVESGIFLLGEVALGFVLALGLASLLGSRAQTVGILLAFRLALTPLILSITFLGSSREAIFGAAFDRLSPRAILDSRPPQVGTSLA